MKRTKKLSEVPQTILMGMDWTYKNILLEINFASVLKQQFSTLFFDSTGVQSSGSCITTVLESSALGLTRTPKKALGRGTGYGPFSVEKLPIRLLPNFDLRQSLSGPFKKDSIIV